MDILLSGFMIGIGLFLVPIAFIMASLIVGEILKLICILFYIPFALIELAQEIIEDSVKSAKSCKLPWKKN